MIRSNERGIAMIVALFMVTVVSVLATSLMFVSQTETLSSRNYRSTSQARYAAESAVHRAANYLLWGGYVPPVNLGGFDVTVSPVRFNGDPVILSSNPDVPANYPDANMSGAFAAAARGTLNVTNGIANYDATATLVSMRQIVDTFSGAPVTLQTWRISGSGAIAGLAVSEVEVSALIERQVTPVFTYAAFATFSGCAALSFAGGATTDSYNSATVMPGTPPAPTMGGGNVGTNGNLSEAGNPTTIHGSLSTPRAGVGNCTTNNVTAATITGNASVEEGLVELSQPVEYPAPEAINPLPPTSSQSFTQGGGCPAGVPACAPSAGGATITPATVGGTVTLGNVSLAGNSVLHLNAGTYVINSLTQAGNSKIVIDSGPVIVKVAGQDVATPISLTGQGISNPTYDPTDLQFIYGGTGSVQMAGGAETAALLYAPNATGSFSGGADFYGAVILKQLTATGGASIHYDTQLRNSAVTAGNHMMSSFTWRSY
jgi:hypothetical protein